MRVKVAITLDSIRDHLRGVHYCKGVSNYIEDTYYRRRGNDDLPDIVDAVKKQWEDIFRGVEIHQVDPLCEHLLDYLTHLGIRNDAHYYIYFD